MNDNRSSFATPTPPPQPTQLRLPLAKPRLTYVLLASIIAVFVFEELAGVGQNPDILLQLGANFGPAVSAGQYWRLFTANFLHVDILHIAFNAYALYILGQETEALYGSPRFMTIFLLSSISGALASFAFNYGPSVGASTGIMGLLGTELAYFIRNRKVFGKIGSRQLNNLIFIGVINFVYGISTPGIDNFGHLGGILGGLILGWLLCPYYQVQPQDNGTHRIVDLNSLRAEWIGVLLFCVLLVTAFLGALSLHPA